MPSNGETITFDLELGEIIHATKLYNSVTIYDSRLSMDEKFYNASLNLLSKQMNFDKDLVEYLEHEFLLYICTRVKSSQISEFPYYFVNCQCKGNEVSGMPEIVLYLKNER